MWRPLLVSRQSFPSQPSQDATIQVSTPCGWNHAWHLDNALNSSLEGDFKALDVKDSRFAMSSTVPLTSVGKHSSLGYNRSIMDCKYWFFRGEALDCCFMSAKLWLNLPSIECCCIALLLLYMRLTTLHRLFLVDWRPISTSIAIPCAVLCKMLLRSLLEVAPRLPPYVSILVWFDTHLELLWTSWIAFIMVI